MPSFRASLAIVEVLPGVLPESVLETGRDAVAAVRHVEDAHVDLASLASGDGLPRIVVRFVEPTANDIAEDGAAWQAADVLAAAVRRVAVTASLRVYRRSGGRWLPRSPPGEPEW